MKKIYSFRLSEEMTGKLDGICAEIGRSRSDTLERVIMNLSSTTITRYAKKNPVYSAAPTMEGSKNDGIIKGTTA